MMRLLKTHLIQSKENITLQLAHHQFKWLDKQLWRNFAQKMFINNHQNNHKVENQTPAHCLYFKN